MRLLQHAKRALISFKLHQNVHCLVIKVEQVLLFQNWFQCVVSTFVMYFIGLKRSQTSAKGQRKSFNFSQVPSKMALKDVTSANNTSPPIKQSLIEPPRSKSRLKCSDSKSFPGPITPKPPKALSITRQSLPVGNRRGKFNYRSGSKGIKVNFF